MKTEQYKPHGFEGSITIKKLTHDERVDLQEKMAGIREKNKSEGEEVVTYRVLRALKKDAFALIQSVDLKRGDEEFKSVDDFEYADQETIFAFCGYVSAGKEMTKAGETQGNDEAK